jgi:predicted phosphoribosyltransferase
MLFDDRHDAGRTLAPLVAALPGLHNAIVLALPRGGVPVAYEVARACGLPLDILTVRKLGAPGQRELALGAVASGGMVALNRGLVAAFRISEEDLQASIDREIEEVARLERGYREGAPPLSIEGRTAILVDDGIATGASIRAAALAVRPHAAQVIIAVPVAPLSTCRELESEAGRVLCAATPEGFEAVSQYYRDFAPTSDEEVRTLLAEARALLQSPPVA